VRAQGGNISDSAFGSARTGYDLHATKPEMIGAGGGFALARAPTM